MNGYESVDGYEPMIEYECMNVKPATLLSRRATCAAVLYALI